MDKRIAALRGHVIVWGWGRVGRAIVRELAAAGKGLVVVDNDPGRIATISYHLCVHGDASDDDVLIKAGIERADALIAAVSTLPANLFITLSGRSLRPDLFIVSRAREESSQPKLERAGADRVVNPGGAAYRRAFPARSSPPWPASSTMAPRTSATPSELRTGCGCGSGEGGGR
jgi:voltage-gated potassium channel